MSTNDSRESVEHNPAHKRTCSKDFNPPLKSVEHNPAHRKRDSIEMPPFMRIVLLGKNVSENSRVGNFMLGRSAFETEAPDDHHSERVRGKHMTVINSPHLLQLNLSDHQITQAVRECVNLSDPGPHVIVLIFKHDECSREDQECVEMVLNSFSDRVYEHTLVLTTHDSVQQTYVNNNIQQIIKKCLNRHFRLERNCPAARLIQTFEDIVKSNDGRYLICAEYEDSESFTVKQQKEERDLRDIMKEESEDLKRRIECREEYEREKEISAYKRLEREYSKWTWSLRSAMMEIENKLQNKIENEAIDEIKEEDLQRELKEKSEEVKKSMSEFFEKDTDKDILIQWKVSFEIKIKELQENIVRETKRKLHEILQQRDLKKKIDADKTRLENTLLEKSKELALKLKDKTNDEDTLKREFDLFWKQCVEMITTDTPLIKDIDIMRDVKDLLSDIYESVPVDTCKGSSDILSLQNYSGYVQLKKSSGITGPVSYRAAKEKFGSVLSKEDEAQIRTLITDVAQQTDKMIKSFNISKMGYNISCIHQLTENIKTRITEYQDNSKYVFKNEFFIDLVFSIFNRANKTFTDQHRMFREANDPVLYVKKKREEYYSIFQKYCHGATSSAIFGEIVCQKLKEPIEQSVYKHTARDLADEMRSNCPSLNGNRSNLENHILKTLAEEESFSAYIDYIQFPKDHFKSFIRDEVSQYISDQFSISVQPKMKKNIDLLQKKIMTAAHESTEHVLHNSGDVDLWLKFFTQKLSDDLIFSVKDFSGVKHDDVDDFKLLEDVIRNELPSIMSDISREFSTDTFNIKLDLNNRPDEILIDHFCQCCWVQCPFCAAVCTNTIENHDGDHSVPFHRNTGLDGFSYRGTTNLSISICTSAVASNRSFYPNASDNKVPWREYRSAGGKYADWSITPDLSELPYWKWVVCRFQEDLEKYHEKTFQGSGEIPDEWRQITKQRAIESLDKYI